MLLDFPQKIPVARAGIFLFHSPRVHRDRRDAAREGSVENLKKTIAALCRVVDPAAHLERYRDLSRDRFPDTLDDFQGDSRLSEVIPATTTAHRRFHGATEIDVNHVESGRDQ